MKKMAVLIVAFISVIFSSCFLKRYDCYCDISNFGGAEIRKDAYLVTYSGKKKDVATKCQANELDSNVINCSLH